MSASPSWPSSGRVPSGYAVTDDGVRVAYYELGGEGPPLLLAHATGFCGMVFGPMASALSGFRCVAFDERAHGASERPREGEDFSWEGFAGDVLAVVDHLGLEQPFGLGHSAGGAALLLAERRRPDTFAGLYCFEPVMVPSEAPLEPVTAGNPLSAAARRRRASFPGREAALRNFFRKAPLADLAPEVLAAYVDNGFAPDPTGGITLRCRPEDEARAYAFSMSHGAFGSLAALACPLTVASGEHTDTLGAEVFDAVAARAPTGEHVVLPGLGHFGPLERPSQVAASFLSSLVVRHPRGRHTPDLG